MNLSEVMNLLLGGGLISAVVAIVTLRSTARRAKADAAKAEAEAETVRMDNVEHATRILLDNLLKPLAENLNETKQELDLTKRELARNTREMVRFRKALERATDCAYREQCPVLDELRKQPKEHEPKRTDAELTSRQRKPRGALSKERACADVGGEPDTECGQPP